MITADYAKLLSEEMKANRESWPGSLLLDCEWHIFMGSLYGHRYAMVDTYDYKQTEIEDVVTKLQNNGFTIKQTTTYSKYMHLEIEW